MEATCLSSPRIRAEITALRKAGESFSSIAAVYGVSRQRIHQLCAQWAVDCPTNNRRADAQVVAEGLALVESGESLGSAAAKVGLHRDTLSRYAAEHGVDVQALAEERSAHLYDGRTFGKWSVVSGSHRKIEGSVRDRELECVCECGTRRWVRLTNLVGGTSRGCGCRSRNGQRKRVPWVCEASGEKVETTAELAKRFGVAYMVLVRLRNQNRPFTDSSGQVWRSDHGAAVPHNVAEPWICIQTRETWPSAAILAEHLGLAKSTLFQAARKNEAYAAEDGRHYCFASSESEIAVRPRVEMSERAFVPQTWICVETGETWESRGQMERHLGLNRYGLGGRTTFTSAGQTYRKL